MPTNMTPIDRFARGLLIAPLLAAFAFLVAGPASLAGVILLVVAAILLLTAIAGFCPLYAALGIGRTKRTPIR